VNATESFGDIEDHDLMNSALPDATHTLFSLTMPRQPLLDPEIANPAI
jgi:hypothetical protein